MLSLCVASLIVGPESCSVTQCPVSGETRQEISELSIGGWGLVSHRDRRGDIHRLVWHASCRRLAIDENPPHRLGGDRGVAVPGLLKRLATCCSASLTTLLRSGPSLRYSTTKLAPTWQEYDCPGLRPRQVGNKLGTILATSAPCGHNAKTPRWRRASLGFADFKHHRNVFPIPRVWQTYRTQNPVCLPAARSIIRASPVFGIL